MIVTDKYTHIEIFFLFLNSVFCIMHFMPSVAESREMTGNEGRGYNWNDVRQKPLSEFELGTLRFIVGILGGV